MPPSGLRPDSAAAVEPRALPFQWSLLAWAALVGALTGLAVVGFHFLLGFINNFLYGPVVEGLIGLFMSAPPEPSPLPQPAPAAGTPLGALLQIGLGGLAFLPPPPSPPEPIPLPVIRCRCGSRPGPWCWYHSWAALLWVPCASGAAIWGRAFQV